MGSSYYNAYLFIVLITVPIYIAFIHWGNENLGRSVFTVLVPILVAIGARWELKKRWWLWGTAIAIFSLNIPLILRFRWPESYVPPIVVLPFAIAEYFVTSKAIDWIEQIAKRYSPGIGDGQS